MATLSEHEEFVWREFQLGNTTREIAMMLKGEEIAGRSEHEAEKKITEATAYVSRVLNRARKKIEKSLREHANSHRLDIESVQDYKGLLIGFDYQANAQVYIIFTIKLGVIVWYKHDSYAGIVCDGTKFGQPNESSGDPCPKNGECRETLDTIMTEYNIKLRPDEEQLYMTDQSIAIFNKLAAKEVPRYKRME